jgi:hypothetical protein
MAMIGQRITHTEEDVAARPRAGLRSGTPRHQAGRDRAHHRPDLPHRRAQVETADIVIPVEWYSLVNEVPVG